MSAPTYTTTLPVRTYDVDAAGIVSNIVYVRWLEDLRTDLLEGFYPAAQQEATGILPVVAATNIEYKRPVRLLDRVTGSIRVEALGRSKMVLGAEFRVSETLVTHATQTCVFVDVKAMRPAEVPRAVREA